MKIYVSVSARRKGNGETYWRATAADTSDGSGSVEFEATGATPQDAAHALLLDLGNLLGEIREQFQTIGVLP